MAGRVHLGKGLQAVTVETPMEAMMLGNQVVVVVQEQVVQGVDHNLMAVLVWLLVFLAHLHITQAAVVVRQQQVQAQTIHHMVVLEVKAVVVKGIKQVVI
jgi:hypothetical protein